jgi:aryl-alcohol dehydrogenase-like predicted oxidoreductase
MSGADPISSGAEARQRGREAFDRPAEQLPVSFEPRELGRTGLRVGRLGVGASYGVPAAAVERAFEQGVNYLYWGSVRRGGFEQALRNLAPQRDRFVLVLQSFSRVAGLVGWSVERALRRLRFERADVLLLGFWNRPPAERLLDAARALRHRGLVRHLALSSHHRPLVARTAAGNDFDVLHFRYNAAHPGAEREIFPYLPRANRPGLVAYTATNWGRLVDAQHPAADCYRFVLMRPEVDVCLCGPANAAEMEEALRALRLGPMNGEELAQMRGGVRAK